jgi:hypothetical protein
VCGKGQYGLIQTEGFSDHAWLNSWSVMTVKTLKGVHPALRLIAPDVVIVPQGESSHEFRRT